eukprot:1159133-Pelagomonas_calceolata.AAC.2
MFGKWMCVLDKHTLDIHPGCSYTLEANSYHLLTCMLEEQAQTLVGNWMASKHPGWQLDGRAGSAKDSAAGCGVQKVHCDPQVRALQDGVRACNEIVREALNPENAMDHTIKVHTMVTMVKMMRNRQPQTVRCVRAAHVRRLAGG